MLWTPPRLQPIHCLVSCSMECGEGGSAYILIAVHSFNSVEHARPSVNIVDFLNAHCARHNGCKIYSENSQGGKAKAAPSRQSRI